MAGDVNLTKTIAVAEAMLILQKTKDDVNFTQNRQTMLILHKTVADDVNLTKR